MLTTKRPCGQTPFVGTTHAFCRNCAGHNPSCADLGPRGLGHCPRHISQFATYVMFGRVGCPLVA